MASVSDVCLRKDGKARAVAGAVHVTRLELCLDYFHIFPAPWETRMYATIDCLIQCVRQGVYAHKE